jgi:Bacterial Ig domain/Bacterial Ig-like domain/Chondroitinase B
MTRLTAAFGACVVVLFAVVLLAVVPGADSAPECTTTVSSTSAAASAVADASAGDTVCLADGTYGKLTLNATKTAPGVTVRAQNPGQATIAGATLSGSYLTVAQFRIAGTFDPRPGSTGMTADHNLFVGGSYYAVVAGDTTTTTVNDVSITNNRFVGRFDEDAMRLNRYHDGPDADPYGILIEGNEFTGNVEYGGHNDVLQSVWVGDHLYFRRNYLHDFGGQGFFVKDQASAIDGLVVEDNLIVRQSSPCDPVSLCPTWQLSPFQIFGPLRNVSIRHNTVWPGSGGGTQWLRGSGWQGPTVFSDNVMANLNSDAGDVTTGYSAANNTRCGGNGFPATGVATDCDPAFIDPANGDYRQANGRGVTWRLADQHFGPGDGGTSPPPDDTTPPNTTISSGPSGETTSTNASFSFSASEPGSTFACRLDASDFASCSSPKAYTGLAVGPHTFSVRATDAAGNVDGTPATAAWTITDDSPGPGDTTAPQTTFTSGPSGPTNDATPTFAFSASESGATFACGIDQGAWSACSSPWTTSMLADGDHSVRVRATDAAGNSDDSPASRSFTVDTKAPHTAITSAPPESSDSAQATVAFTVDEAGTTSECKLDDGAWVACTSPHQLTGLGDGAHTVAVRSRDAAGNIEAPGTSASWTVELPDGGEPPAPGGAAPAVRLAIEESGTYFGRSLALATTADDDHSVDHVDFWVDGTRVASDGEAPYTARVSAGTLAIGTHTLSVRAFDAAGQAGSSAITARVYDGSRGRAWTASTSGTRLRSYDNGNGAIQLWGRTAANRTVRVGLTVCGDASGEVADRFDLTADDDGRLDLVYAGDGLCVLELRSRWR